MKPRAIQKQDCHRYPLEYIVSNIHENGVAEDFKNPVKAYKEEEHLFWLALRENAGNDNCFAFCVHNWPSIVHADPQWSPHTTQLWDTVVDVCNGGFPQSANTHVHYICNFIPLLNEKHIPVFKKDIFNTWSHQQWLNFFNIIEDYTVFKNAVGVISTLSKLTDQDLSKYTAHVLLSWSAHKPQLVNDLAQTPIGQTALQYIAKNKNIYVPYVLDLCNAFDESSITHKALHTLSQHIDLNLDQTTQKLVARSFIYCVGYNVRGQTLQDKYITDHAKECLWVKRIWDALPQKAHTQVIHDFGGYWSVVVRGVENLLAWDFNAHHLCRYLEEEISDLANNDKFPHISAYLQSQHIHEHLPQVTHEKLRKL